MESTFPGSIHLRLVLFFCPLFTGGQHWGETEDAALHVDHMDSMAGWPLTSGVALGKSAEPAVPRYSIY